MLPWTVLNCVSNMIWFMKADMFFTLMPVLVPGRFKASLLNVACIVRQELTVLFNLLDPRSVPYLSGQGSRSVRSILLYHSTQRMFFDLDPSVSP